ncbi:MAG TPA: ATP-binding protein [Acidimicrobiales bacterium]|jgi:signal transduction histidine kinase|nr:ATP-binding protein [Acidimicrobiales bacterium]
MQRSVLQGLGVFRWAAWMWVALVVAFSPADMVREWLAALLLVVSFAFTFVWWRWRHQPERVLHPTMVAVELVIGASMLALDGLVRPEGEVFISGQSLASVWPLTGLISASIVLGPAAGAVAGVGLGGCRYLSTVLNDVTDYGDGRVLSMMSTAVMYAMAGAAFGYVYRLLQQAREEVAAAAAREEIARTLHDGVLQTLALVERRATDPALSRLAREQERDLRNYLFGDQQATGEDLGAALRRCAGRFEETFGGRVQVLVPDDLPRLPETLVHALSGAVGEALTNAGKHGEAERVVVFVDVDGEVFCSVKDDGRGFDPSTTVEGVGLSRSIRGRMADVDGTVAVVSAPGEGTEVSLRVPLPARR